MCQELPTRLSAVPAYLLINSQYFDAAVRAQKEVIYIAIARFTAAVTFISPERFLNKHSPQMLMGMNVPHLADFGFTSVDEPLTYRMKVI